MSEADARPIRGLVNRAKISTTSQGAQTMNIPGIALNEDDSHYFFTRAGQVLTAADVAAWGDQYTGTQVKQLLLCPNCMRTSYASDVWDPIWRDYDPSGPDDQPLLASTQPEERANVRGWIH